MSKHTPGPWAWTTIGEKTNGYIVGVGCDLNGKPLSGRVEPDDLVEPLLEIGSHEASTVNYADPELIASAPRLLFELKNLCEKVARLEGIEIPYPIAIPIGVALRAAEQAVIEAERR